jgi:hypothetical protein
MSCYLFSFLYQSEDSLIRDNKMRSDILDFFEFVLENLSKIIFLFYIKKRYSFFDPHIGDTACQIRACFLSELSNSVSTIYSPQERINKVDFLYKTLLEYRINSSGNQEKNNHQTIRDLFEKIGLDIEIPECEKILFQSWFLTHYKIKIENKVFIIDYERISQDLNISRKLSKKLVRSYQLSVASYSCSKIFQWASQLHSSDFEILKELKRVDDDGREVLPCYLFTKVIFYYALRFEIPLHVIASVNNKIYPFYFKPNHDLATFVFTEDLENELDKPCIIITGHSKGSSKNYPEKLLLTGIKNILLSAMAAHPQYTGKKLAPFCENIFNGLPTNCVNESISEEMSYMRLLANTLGCSYENQSLFVVNHIFCGTIHTQNAYFGLELEKKTIASDSKGGFIDETGHRRPLATNSVFRDRF